MMSRIKLLLDCGAFSAWRQNTTIDLDAYIKFVRQIEKHLWMYVNLDVIPGSIGRNRTRQDTEAAAKASYENLQRMKDAGLRPLPVFHQGESFEWFEKMVADGETYIGISTAKNQPNIIQERWLNDFFSMVTDSEGRPLVKLHGFGSGSVDLLRRLPFQSVDSAGWCHAAAHGKVYVPALVNDQLDYLAPPFLVSVTGNYMRSRFAQKRQLENLPSQEQEAIKRFLADDVGCPNGLGNVRYDVQWRARATATYYLKASAALADRQVTFARRRRDVFDPISLPPIKLDPLRYVFSTAYDGRQFDALRAVGAEYDLLSYYTLRKRTPEAIEDYLNGRFNMRKPRGFKLTDAHFGNRRYRDFRSRVLLETLAHSDEAVR